MIKDYNKTSINRSIYPSLLKVYIHLKRCIIKYQGDAYEQISQ